MYAGSQEWQRSDPTAELRDLSPSTGTGHASLYRSLLQHLPDDGTRSAAAQFIRNQLERVQGEPDDLPAQPGELLAWMESNTQSVHARYAAYLAGRKEGAPRRFFTNRAHALHVLRQIAPTKLVDGAWLYGLVRHAGNPKMSDLVRTYVEELGEGDPRKNHVVLYRDLMTRYNLDPLDDLDDALYTRGAIQLALGATAEEFLPEVIGFNLSYEQLPLHLLITAHELNELGLDPYYFTLHVTVDNGDTGHARRACQAVLDMLPRLAGGGAFWERVRAGAKLANVAPGTMDVVNGFRIDEEVVRILARKSVTGQGAHSDYCRVAGRNVNEWLSSPAEIPRFLTALESASWIKRGKPVDESRFWGLLQGPRAEMFGVFSSYELQVIHDWIRGDASADGAAFTQGPAPEGRTRRASFRAMQRARPGPAADSAPTVLDPDLDALNARLATADAQERDELLVEAMSPALHWTPAGLAATRMFWSARSR